MLRIESRTEGDVAILRLKGDVDEEGVTDLRIALVNCMKEKLYNVVVDLSGMRFISYMGVGVLVERLRQLRSYSGDMKLVGMNLYTERLFRMTGVTSLFETYETDSQAVRGFKRAA